MRVSTALRIKPTSAVTELHTKGAARVFPLFQRRPQPQNATGAALQTSGVIEAHTAVILLLVQTCGARFHQQLQGLFIGIGLHNDVRMLFIDIEFIDAQFDVHIDGRSHKTVTPFMPSLIRLMKPTFLPWRRIFLRISSGALPSMVNRSRATPTASSG